MPTYTLRSLKNNHEWDVTCSFEELNTIIDEMEDVVRVIKPPKIVTGVGNLHSKVPDGFRDKLKQIKRGSGRDNTIKI